jgi:uncharacterized membrane protein YeaQ/YmgE (transglycosylase-associated protein family)
MGMLLYIVIGGALGWAACLLWHTDSAGVFRNVVAGMAGALLGAWLFAGLLGSGVFSPSGFGIDGLAEAALGAIALILLNQLTLKRIRRHD